jgi:glycosyltransferase involved in cell wall biosynthesis
MTPAPAMAVVICSLDGADGVRRCLESLARQTIASRLEVIVVDDGSTDATAEVAEACGARVLRHEVNRGLAAARNTGVLAASAPVVAFLDDDCAPDPTWAETLLAGYEDDVLGVGGVVEPQVERGYVGRFHERHNPLMPIEAEILESEALPYRLKLYLRRQWRRERPEGRRPVHSLVGANMSFRRDALVRSGLFDDRFRFGSEDLDMCRKVLEANPEGRLILEPRCRIDHHFDSSLRDTLRRSYAYGVGAARYYRKWPTARPTIYPFPLAAAGLLVAALRRPWLLPLAVLVPQLMFPDGVRMSRRERSAEPLLDPAMKLASEAVGNAGFVAGLWRFRHLSPQAAAGWPSA